MTPHVGAGRFRIWFPRVALVVLPVLWIYLGTTLPIATNREVTVDVSCSSGFPVAAVWIESTSGASWYATESPRGTAPFQRFTFKQRFMATYQIRAGCGGTQQQWGITAVSTYGANQYRRVVCDDVHINSISVESCADRPGG
ncbi:hypothetical protein ABZ345_36225 [Lentzea sp. NPDC005914]|uniref:hypothetical protein n=1 Tax=Lentzea sp. NPDC005914 TaxID=3154572 RepID=UPI00340BB0BA